MTIAIAVILLCCLAAAWTLLPLWFKAADRDPGDGLESDDRVVKWREEKDRLVAEMVALDVAFAEQKIDGETYASEKGRVMEEAEQAAEELRKARSGARTAATGERTYPILGGVIAGSLVLATVALTFFLNAHDVRTDVNPHASGSVPLTAAQMANTPPGGQTAAADPHAALGSKAPPLDANGAPDVGAMVAKLEAKVKAGSTSLDDVMMLARSYRVMGQKPESVAMYRKALDLAPDQPELKLVLASALLRSDNADDRKEAEVIVDAALVAEPSKPEALWLKSIGLIRRHEIAPAKVLLGRLKTIVADKSDASSAVTGLLAELDAMPDSPSVKGGIEKQVSPTDPAQPSPSASAPPSSSTQ